MSDYVFRVTLSRMPIPTDMPGIPGKIYAKIIATSQKNAWEVINKAMFSMMEVDFNASDVRKETEIELKKLGTQTDALANMRKFVNLKPEAFEKIEQDISKFIPRVAKRYLRKLKGKYHTETHKEVKVPIDRLTDALNTLFIYIDYEVRPA